MQWSAVQCSAVQCSTVGCHRAVRAAASPALVRRLEGPEVRTRDGGWVRLEGPDHHTLVLAEVAAMDLLRLLCLLYNT